jgi:hypothetical protein
MKYLIRIALEVSHELHTLKEFIHWNSKKFSDHLSEEWIDSQQVMTVLKIKKRALQNLRDMSLLPFSTIHGKLYYKVSDVEELLKSNYMTKKRKDHGND